MFECSFSCSNSRQFLFWMDSPSCLNGCSVQRKSCPIARGVDFAVGLVIFVLNLTDDNCFQTDSPSCLNRSHFPFERIAQAVQMDDNFFRTDSPSHSNGWQFFDEQIPRAVQTDTKSVQKTANRKEHFHVRGHAKGLTKYVHYVH